MVSQRRKHNYDNFNSSAFGYDWDCIPCRKACFKSQAAIHFGMAAHRYDFGASCVWIDEQCTAGRCMVSGLCPYFGMRSRINDWY